MSIVGSIVSSLVTNAGLPGSIAALSEEAVDAGLRRTILRRIAPQMFRQYGNAWQALQEVRDRGLGIRTQDFYDDIWERGREVATNRDYISGLSGSDIPDPGMGVSPTPGGTYKYDYEATVRVYSRSPRGLFNEKRDITIRIEPGWSKAEIEEEAENVFVALYEEMIGGDPSKVEGSLLLETKRQ